MLEKGKLKKDEPNNVAIVQSLVRPIEKKNMTAQIGQFKKLRLENDKTKPTKTAFFSVETTTDSMTVNNALGKSLDSI